jgi:hypothetical protein
MEMELNPYQPYATAKKLIQAYLELDLSPYN